MAADSSYILKQDYFIKSQVLFKLFDFRQGSRTHTHTLTHLQVHTLSHLLPPAPPPAFFLPLPHLEIITRLVNKPVHSGAKWSSLAVEWESKICEESPIEVIVDTTS